VIVDGTKRQHTLHVAVEDPRCAAVEEKLGGIEAAERPSGAPTAVGAEVMGFSALTNLSE
jgi:hypothetical protein